MIFNYLTKDKKPYTEDVAIREVCGVVSNTLKRAYTDIPEGDVIQAYANNAISMVEAIHKDSKTLGKMFGFAVQYIRNSQCIALGEPFEMSFTSKSGSYEIAVYQDGDEWLLHLLSIEQDGNIHKYQPNLISSPTIGRFVNSKMGSFAETSIGGSIGKVVCETINELQHLLNFQKYMEKK